MIYYVHVAAEPHEPMPPLDDLAAIEADLTPPRAAVMAGGVFLGGQIAALDLAWLES